MNVDPTSIYDKMPAFTNHDEARKWFKKQYGDRFLLRSSDVINGEQVYFYHIIKHPETYQQYMESFAKEVKHEITNMETFHSYSTVEISENGDVNIIV